MRKTVDERFVVKIKKGDNKDDCWIWLGSKTVQGYGRISIAGKLVATHRIAYEMFKGKIPDGLQIRHSCDNPPCCNPAHLLLGTNFDNVQDKIQRGRQGVENIRAALKGKPFSREHLANLRASPANRKGRPVRFIPPRKMPIDQIPVMLEMFAAGASQNDLAEKFGVSRGLICKLTRQHGVKRIAGYGTNQPSHLHTHGNSSKEHSAKMKLAWQRRKKNDDAKSPG